MSTLLLPAERWQRIAQAYSAHLTAEHKGHKPIPVRTAEHGGFLYTVFGVLHGPYGESVKPYADAYRLIPESLYSGETTLVYHDEAAIQSGRRMRGDHTGLIVSVKGKLMVCERNVRFIMDLPATRPLPRAEAMVFDESARASGWRAIWFKGRRPEWFSLRGHPVAVYREHATLGTDHAVLYWKHEGQIQELSIADDVRLDAPEWSEAASPGNGQLMLF